MLTFKLDGVDSSTKGVYLTDDPSVMTAPKQVTFEKIPGRAGPLTIDKGGYDAFNAELNAYWDGTGSLDSILGWLDGSHELIISSRDDKRMNVYIAGDLASSRIARTIGARTLSIPMTVMPFRYFVPEPNPVEITSTGGSVNNLGTVFSEPKIQVFVTGDGTLQVGQYIAEITGATTSVIIDTAKMEVYGNDGITRFSGVDMEEFPKLVPGINYIQFDEDITKVKIWGRWRDR